MKSKMCVSVVLALVLLAGSAVVAHAGGGGVGGGPYGDVVLTDCYRIVSNSNATYTMDVTDQFGTRQQVQVGSAQFVCVVSGQWQRTPGSNSPPLNEAFNPATINAAKCYDVVAPGDLGPGTVGTVVDLFGTETAVLKRLSLLCTPATLGAAGE